ncbi:MAG: UDP-3-O-(3-hydroxymyristoyl)glucosamine N-acyltransferase [Chlamydiales bacterium]
MSEKGSYSLLELADLTGSKLAGNENYRIEGVEDLESAGPQHACFLENPRYQKQVHQSQAGVVFVPLDYTPLNGKNFLLNPHPSLAFQKVIELFIKPIPSSFSNIHPTAIIHQTVVMGKNVTVGPNVVIDQGVSIGDGTIIEAGSFIGAESTIGSMSHIHANVVIREKCRIGNKVMIQPGAVIGSCGFGYFTDKSGKHFPLKQLGEVVVEDEVEIGANTTIDRARYKTTRIGKGTKIDNLVQIAHQVCLGEGNIIVSQVGIAGSTKTGRNVVIGGQVGINGHIYITDNVTVAARSAVSKSLKKSGLYYGIPAVPYEEFKENLFQMRSIGKLAKAFKGLEAKINTFEKKAAQGNIFQKLFKKFRKK